MGAHRLLQLRAPEHYQRPSRSTSRRLFSLRGSHRRCSRGGRDGVDFKESRGRSAVDYVPSMTAHSTRARRHGLGALGVAATLLVALASTASATTPPDSTTPADGSAAPADTRGRRTPPPTWRRSTRRPKRRDRSTSSPCPTPGRTTAGSCSRSATSTRASTTRCRTPTASSADELTAVETQRGIGHDARLDRRRPAVRPAGHRGRHLGPVHADGVGRDPRRR